MKKGAYLLLTVVLASLIGCRAARGQGTKAEERDYWPTSGWKISTPEAQGMDSERLADMLDLIRETGFEIDSVLVVRNGCLVTDAYVHPFNSDTKHVIHSCTKSIVSALIGIAIQEGYLAGTDQRLLNIFPDRIMANPGTDKSSITVEDILTMSTGLKCRDSYLYDWRGLREMRSTDDWVQYILDLPMERAPGTQFEYCNGASFLLSAILQETTSNTAADWARERLFSPLGIGDVTWPANPQGISIGWGGIEMRPHDMAKIGYLYLNQGRWASQQIVPAEWVAASTRKHIDGTLQDGYGYQWWIARDAYMALGYAGQYIIVDPDRDVVVVITSNLEERNFYVPQELFEEYIVTAVKSRRALPDNPNGVTRLLASTEALARP